MEYARGAGPGVWEKEQPPEAPALPGLPYALLSSSAFFHTAPCASDPWMPLGGVALNWAFKRSAAVAGAT
eukprot:3918007-Alexandrium_andersonii.AAC.1